MKKLAKQFLALTLSLIMVLSIAPFGSLTGIATEAKAAGVSHYNGIVAAKWAEDHLNDSWSYLVGKGYYDPKDGGDCANFVSQCIYMGGMDMNKFWNYNGYLAHFGSASNGSWIRAHRLYEYVVSQGGESINAPSASQVSIGDLIFWKTTNDGLMHHSAIVVDIVNGVPEIAYHSTRYPNGAEKNVREKNWTLGYASNRIYLVKMHGETCVSSNPKNFDVYIARASSPFRASADKNSAKIKRDIYKGEYIHVYQTRQNQGYTWGYCNFLGEWGWTNLGNFAYSYHASSYTPSHVFADWFTATAPTCISEGVSKRICTRCGYEETRSIAANGHTPGAEATCTTPQLCTVCNALIKDALGHDIDETLVEADCLNDAYLDGKCKRCDITYSYEATSAPWSDWSPVSHKVNDSKDERTRTAYRWRQKDTKVTNTASEAGWTKIKSEWEQTGSGVKRWFTVKDGWSADNWFYQNLAHGQPYSAYENATNKRTVSNSFAYYINAHWCRGDNSLGAIDRQIQSYSSGRFTTFHAFDSQENYNHDVVSNGYKHRDTAKCGDTFWWHTNLHTVAYDCYYTDYRIKCTWEKYSDWSDWTTASEFPETIQQMIRDGKTQLTSGNTTYYLEQRQEYQYSLKTALGHDWHEDDSYLEDAETGKKIWEVTKEPTVDEEGEAVCICNRDPSHTATIILPKLNCEHNWSDWTEIPCPEGGTSTRTCSICGSSESRMIEEGHVWGEWETVTEAVAHVSDGLERRVCRRNPEHIEERTIDAHTLDFVGNVPATCTEEGYDSYRCTVCDDFEVKKNIVIPLGHDMSGFYLSKPAVCNKDGSITEGEEVSVCRRCGYEIIRPVTTEHDIQPVTAVTVIYPGDERYANICEIHNISYVCTKCGFVQKTETKEIEHNWKTDEKGELVWNVIEEASHGHNGSAENICLNHSEHRQLKTLPMPDDHDFKQETVNEPCSYDAETGTERKGITYIKYTCTICGLEHSTEPEFVDHQFGEWAVTKEASCYESGEQQRTCTVCGYPEKDSIDGGHKWGDPYQLTEASCYDAGSMEHKCSVCGLVEAVGDETPALGHLWADGIDENDSETWTIVEEASCTKDGLRKIVCQRDASHVKTEPIPATGHKYTKTGEEPATCIEPKYEIYTCSKCNDSYKLPIGQPAGHKGEAIPAVLPTCEEDGQTSGAKCSVCGEILVEPKTVSALGHDWDDGVIDPDSTCTEEGVKTFTCKRDSSHTRTEPVEPKGHTEEEIPAVLPTCEKDGQTAGVKCSVCGEILVEPKTVPALGHDWDEGVIDPDSTCTEEGVKTFTCKRDSSHTRTEPVEPKGHTEEEIPAVPPTCEEDGQTSGVKCSVCGEILVEPKTVSAPGHDWDDGVIDPDPTCTEEGVKTFTCKRDSSHTRTEPVEPKGHTEEEIPAVPPTCEEDGQTSGVKCSVCGEILVEPKTVPALGHDWDEGVIDPDSTCTEEGVKTFTCKRDSSHTRTEPVEPKGHTEEEIPAVPPTCEEDGQKSGVKCSVCGEILVEPKTVPALGHDWDEGVIDPDSTCTEEGVKTFTCKRDSSHTRTEPIEPKGHTPEKVDGIAATCTESGKTEGSVCTVCGTILDGCEFIPALGHAYGEWETVKPATCTESGEKQRVCANDNSHIEAATIEPTDHDWTGKWVVTKKPTIYAKGEETLCCKNDSSHKQTREIDKLVSYTATFIADGKTVDVVRFAAGTKYITEPDLKPYDKDNYTVAWEEYELNDKDIVIHAVYTPIDPEDVSEIETEKTVDKFENGIATITLSASAASRTISFDSTSTKPADVILVLDRSGSMKDTLGSGATKVEALQTCAKSFLEKLNQNAVATGADHRVALVGFGSGAYGYSGGRYQSLNYEGTGVLATADGSTEISYKDIADGKWNAWGNTFIPVGNILGVNKTLTEAIDRIEPNGATQTDLGLKMAQNILSAYHDGSDREKIVILITDGDPTNYSSTRDAIQAVVPNAVEFAKDIKMSGAKLYTIGIKDNADPNRAFDGTQDGITGDNNSASFDFNRFLNIVSSNYPSAEAMNNHGDKENNGYYMAVTNTDNLNNIFSTILVSSVYKTLTFKRATIVDTLSSDFTLTLEQEYAMRENLRNTLDIEDSDISVSRNADGTTTLRIENVPAVKTVADGKTVYTASVTFDCSLNKPEAGSYDTNTDDAYVEIDGEKVADLKKPEKVNVALDRNIVVFTINGEVYRIWEGNLGDKIVVPETELAKWTVDENVTKSYAVYEADEINTTEHTVTWVVDGKETKQTYRFGEKITAPEVPEKDGLEFKGWSPAVANVMPNIDLTYTAIYGAKHVHSYRQTLFYGSCEDGLVIVSTCLCGDEKQEKQPAGEHKFKAVINTTEDTVYETLICDVCKKSESHTLKFKMEQSSKGKVTVIDFSLLNDGVEIQPNGNGIKIMIPLTQLNLRSVKNVSVKRLNEDGTEKKYTPTRENGYLVFYADHFSIYVISELDEKGNPLEEIDFAHSLCLLNGHSCKDTVTAPTCTEKGYTTHTCTVCGESYSDSETAAKGHTFAQKVVEPTCDKDGKIINVCTVCSAEETEKVLPATGHTDADNNGKCDICGKETTPEAPSAKCTHICHKGGFAGFIWSIIRIFLKIFKARPVCSCGAAHY